MSYINILEEISKLKKEKNALILAHYYQKPEIQDLADYIGDSLYLAKISADNDASIIVFCGVNFMAETAKILSPEKTVLLPDLEAGCSLADSCSYEDFKLFKDKFPNHKVISYINCSAKIKTLSDIICTSSNAIDIVNSFDKDENLIFAPDKNLGSYVNEKTGRNMVLWDGSCHVHDQLRIEKVFELQAKYSNAILIAHPECQGPILELADFIGSTSAMLNYVNKSDKNEFIVATETGINHQMKKNNPEKKFYIVPSDETCNCNDCSYMKVIDTTKVFNSLEKEIYKIELESNIIEKAKKPLLNMLNLT